MTETNGALARLRLPQFPRSNGYDPAWVVANQMGPHPLWLLESLLEHMPIEPEMRVLDLGCGTALTSIFLAREFGAQVWAADLWIDPTRNWERIREAEVADLVAPIRVEAHDLPFAGGFFEAIVSIDAYEYFGTDDLYLAWGLSRVLAPGGRIGMVTPGLRHEIDDVPESLKKYWGPDFWTFHSPDWWRRNWERSGAVDVELADLVSGGWDLWHLWAEVLDAVGARGAADAPAPPEKGGDDLALLDDDTTRLIGFTRMVGRRSEPV
jgi:cyclopropane fatty-acyl-phospholipid synthase-like methyltransferase